MPTLWIVHRSPEVRAALAALVADAADSVLGRPTDRLFETVAAPDAVLLAWREQPDLELDFALRFSQRYPSTRWLLLPEGPEALATAALFDALPAQVLPYPPAPEVLMSALRLSAVIENLSQRRLRHDLEERFTCWFADLDLSEVTRALNADAARIPLLVRGEVGTGRGLLTRYIHYLGGLRSGHLVALRCDFLAERAAFERELRACEGAETRQGLTLCLEEINLLSPMLQTDLARRIELDFPTVGAVRWVATLRETPDGCAPVLEPALHDALAGLEIWLPPLRKRRAALPSLVYGMSDAWCRKHGEPQRRWSQTALDNLAAYPWPGNVRELEAVVARTLARSPGDPIALQDLCWKTASSDKRSEPKNPEHPKADAVAMLSDAIDAERPLLAARQIRVVRELGAEAICVKADPPQLKSVLTSLVHQGVTALSMGGEVYAACSLQATRELPVLRALLRFRQSEDNVFAPVDESDSQFQTTKTLLATWNGSLYTEAPHPRERLILLELPAA